MKQQAIIWKKSVYMNNFICPICGNKLFDVTKNRLMEDNVGFVPPYVNDVLCIKCHNPVAVIREIDGNVETGLQGEYDEKRYGKL